MPYIPQRKREALTPTFEEEPSDPGELNYALTMVCEGYRNVRLNTVGDGYDSYAVLAEIVAALECVKLEFVRQVMAPYEDKKIEANGPVHAPIRVKP